ncbi:hypothetical protein [Metaclostridioides mangenotii]|uniref:hypothetical protein n=1 Tax=Metaclostridioides mangenotii TaxID=1540 RepID=UPI0004B3313A|nr:hypothetical protein [Clostridioides mangenotii]
MDYKKLNEYKQQLKRQEKKFYDKYEDEESMANDLLDLALGIINKQNAIIQIYEKVEE